MIISSILSLVGCKKTATDNEGMLKIAREEIPIASADTIDIQIIGSIDKDESRLVCFMTGNEYQGHSYFPIEFKITRNKKYEFFKVYKMGDRGMDIYVELWKDGYVFIVNNEACKNIQLTLSNGNKELVEVDEYPFLLYTDEIPSEYNFLDIDGNEI